MSATGEPGAMAEKIVCPDKTRLQRLLLGELPEADAERLEQHLLGCQPCGAAVQTLTGQDTLMDALQGAGQAPGVNEEEVIRVLSERIKSLRRPVGGAATIGPEVAVADVAPAGQDTSAF